jgi:hypothetical protein
MYNKRVYTLIHLKRSDQPVYSALCLLERPYTTHTPSYTPIDVCGLVILRENASKRRTWWRRWSACSCSCRLRCRRCHVRLRLASTLTGTLTSTLTTTLVGVACVLAGVATVLTGVLVALSVAACVLAAVVAVAVVTVASSRSLGSIRDQSCFRG